MLLMQSEHILLLLHITRLVWETGHTVVELTGRAAHDRLFDYVAARRSLLKALGPLLQEPLSCHLLQLPANTQTPASAFRTHKDTPIGELFCDVTVTPV